MCYVSRLRGKLHLVLFSHPNTNKELSRHCLPLDFYPLQVDNPMQSQLLLEAFGHSFEAEAPQSHTT